MKYSPNDFLEVLNKTTKTSREREEVPQQASEHSTYKTKSQKLKSWGSFLCIKLRALPAWLSIPQQGHEDLALRDICLYFTVTYRVDEPIISESYYTSHLLSGTNVNLN